jgi:anti-anti-sigma regulatory factor
VVQREAAAIVVIARGGRVVATLRLPATDGIDLATVDHVARLCLLARRHGCSIRLRAADPDLRSLLGLAGLGDVVDGR